jgi:hypothetical protein
MRTRPKSCVHSAILSSDLATAPCGFLTEGQRIRINRGSLEGVEGILMKKKSEWRMVVSVTMLQRSIAVEIDHDWIDAIQTNEGVERASVFKIPFQ